MAGVAHVPMFHNTSGSINERGAEKSNKTGREGEIFHF
jgi:hypothetical protein